MSRTRRIPMDLLAVLEAAYNGDGDLSEAVAPIVAMLHGSRSTYAYGCRCPECAAANAEYQRSKAKVRLAAKLAADPDSAPHGTVSTYTNYGCRCESCTEVHSAACASAAKHRADRLAADPTIRPHGVEATCTGWGCRCEPCTAAAAEANRKRYQARKAAAMT